MGEDGDLKEELEDKGDVHVKEDEFEVNVQGDEVKEIGFQYVDTPLSFLKFYGNFVVHMKKVRSLNNLSFKFIIVFRQYLKLCNCVIFA